MGVGGGGDIHTITQPAIKSLSCELLLALRKPLSLLNVDKAAAASFTVAKSQLHQAVDAITRGGEKRSRGRECVSLSHCADPHTHAQQIRTLCKTVY